jgi:hypothetical protein
LHKYYHTKAQIKPQPKLPTLTGDTPKFEIDTSVLLAKPSLDESVQAANLIAESMDVIQIERDVARCTWHLLSGTQRSKRVQYQNKDRKKVSSLLKKKQRRLANLINLTLVESYDLAPSIDDRLRYYQGYHDVACIFLHALGGGNSKPKAPSKTEEEEDRMGLDLPARVLCQVSYSHFRDHLRSDFLSLQTALKIALFPLLRKMDREVHDHLLDCDMEPFFCLSWVLTWFSHDVRDTALVKRLFDAFLCSHPLFPLYVCVAMIVHPVNRNIILQTDCDFAALHQCLASLPRNSCRVGWKRGCDGEGFVSDEEDDRTVSTDMDSNWDNEFFLNNEERSMSLATSASIAGNLQNNEERSMSLATSASIAGNQSVASSRNSMSVGTIPIEETYNQVPFQELIDTGLGYMRRFPPRSLMDLAKKYYKKEWAMADEVVNISLLQNPPSWSLAPTAKADWVLKQRVRQELGLKPTSRKDRRKKAQLVVHSKSKDEQPTTDYATPLVDKDYLKEYQWTLAVIAVGYGPGPEAVERKRRNRRMMRAAVAIGVVAIVMGIAYQYRSRASSDSCKSTTSGAKKLLGNNPSPEVVLEAPSTDIIASSSVADGLVANTTVEVDVSSSTVEPSADIIASSSATDGLVANTAVEVDVSSLTVEPSADIIASSSAADGLVASTTVEVDVSSSTIEPSADIIASSSSADGLVANTTVEVDVSSSTVEPSADIIASSSAADGLVASTTVEVEVKSPSTPATVDFTNYFTKNSDSQETKDAPFAAEGQIQKDVPIDAPSLAKVESKLVPMLDMNTNSKIKLQVPTEQMIKRMIALEASEPVVSSSGSLPPPMLMLRKVAQSMYRFLYHIRAKWVGKLRHLLVRQNNADGEDRIPFGRFMGSLRNLWDKLPSAPRDAQRV